MPKCPYCNIELELNLTLKPVQISDEFKDQAMTAIEGFIDIQAEAAPFGGKMMKSMSKYTLKWQRRYFDKVGALPIMLQTCKNCDAVIGTNTFINISPYSKSD
jgi:hypothetical protein